jgi:hypothetical protein
MHLKVGIKVRLLVVVPVPAASTVSPINTCGKMKAASRRIVTTTFSATLFMINPCESN